MVRARAHEVDRALVQHRWAIAALGPLLSGLLLQHFWWGSVFLITLPLAVVALVLAARLVPAHVNEATDPVDNLGGILSMLLVGALILGINFRTSPRSTRGSRRTNRATKSWRICTFGVSAPSTGSPSTRGWRRAPSRIQPRRRARSSCPNTAIPTRNERPG
jgi:hypothetical protein